MPRRTLVRQSQYPYHVRTRNNNKDWFSIPLSDVWDICKVSLTEAQVKFPVTLHCFVLMSNHYHMLITTPNSDIDQFMMVFNLKLSRLISKQSKHINHKFSNGYKWSMISHESYLMNVYRYIYQNPVRAGLSTNCISYPYSSLNFSSCEEKLFRHSPHFKYASQKLWIEKRYGPDMESIIRKSLKKEVFKPEQKISRFCKEVLHSFVPAEKLSIVNKQL